METEIKLDKTYKTNFKLSGVDLFLTLFLFSFIIIFSVLGLSFISFIISILFFFKAYRIFLKFKNTPAFFKIKKSKSGSDFELFFYDSNKKLIVSDLLGFFIFFKGSNKIFEISHNKLRKNLLLVSDVNIRLFYQFLIDNNIKVKKFKKNYKFWEIVELILMK